MAIIDVFASGEYWCDTFGDYPLNLPYISANCCWSVDYLLAPTSRPGQALPSAIKARMMYVMRGSGWSHYTYARCGRFNACIDVITTE